MAKRVKMTHCPSTDEVLRLSTAKQPPTLLTLPRKILLRILEFVVKRASPSIEPDDTARAWRFCSQGLCHFWDDGGVAGALCRPLREEYISVLAERRALTIGYWDILDARVYARRVFNLPQNYLNRVRSVQLPSLDPWEFMDWPKWAFETVPELFISLRHMVVNTTAEFDIFWHLGDHSWTIGEVKSAASSREAQAAIHDHYMEMKEMIDEYSGRNFTLELNIELSRLTGYVRSPKGKSWEHERLYAIDAKVKEDKPGSYSITADVSERYREWTSTRPIWLAAGCTIDLY